MEICCLENICKSYGNKKVLDNFCYSIKENDFICITGKSGSGKSTLLNIIGLLEKPDSGNYTIYNQKNIKLNSKNTRLILKNKIGFLFQNFALIDEQSISYNLDIALKNYKISKKKSQKLKKEVLKKVNLDLPLESKIFQLSGGEQQRVAMGRILLKNCDLILADEPTGSLDEYNRNYILELLKELNNNGKTIIIASHDSYIINSCKGIIKL